MSDFEAVAAKTYQAIGKFIFEFSQLEYSIRHHVGVEAGLKEDHITAVMTHDFALLCTAAVEVLSNNVSAEDQRALVGIFRECHKMNAIRVKVVHGLWVPFQDGGTVHHVSRSSLKPSMSIEQAVLLETQAGQVNNLRARFESWMWESDGMGG